jgi:hypothetical protein
VIAPKQRRQGGYRLPGAEVKRRPDTDMRARLWKAMRVIRRFDVGQLMVATDATRTNAQDYVSKLVRAGFLRMAVKGNATARRMAIYQLVRDSGPLAPITRKTGDTFDQNTKTTYLQGGVAREEPDGATAP